MHRDLKHTEIKKGLIAVRQHCDLNKTTSKKKGRKPTQGHMKVPCEPDSPAVTLPHELSGVEERKILDGCSGKRKKGGGRGKERRYVRAIW